MRLTSNNLAESFITLKNDAWFNRQKIAGECVAKCLNEFKSLVQSAPTISLLDIEQQCLKFIKEYNCEPTFRNFNGFPGSVCLSVNTQLVHGIPSDYVLQDGDVVSLDLGATYEGAIADAAYTCIYGTPKNNRHVRLLEACQKALEIGISAIEIGKQLGVIGNAISKFSKKTEFGLITNYGGHGLDYNLPHAHPFVSNQAKPTEGIRIQPGLSIAIEPMMSLGEPTTVIEDDGWTVSTPDIGCHFEHSVLVTEEKIHIITELNG
jgi:methionyl aminopeptidase